MLATIPERTAQPDCTRVDQTGVAAHDAPARPALLAGESVPVLLTRRTARVEDRPRRRARTKDRWRRALAVLLVGVSAVAVGIAVRQTAEASDLATNARVQPGTALRLELPDVPGVVAAADHVTLPSAVLDGLVPGDVRTFTVQVSNDADADVLVTSAFAWAPVPSGQGFVDEPEVRVEGVPPQLGPGESVVATVRVSTPESWDAANRGRTGRLVVRFVGMQA